MGTIIAEHRKNAANMVKSSFLFMILHIHVTWQTANSFEHNRTCVEWEVMAVFA
jgi:hypothetical protein